MSKKEFKDNEFYGIGFLMSNNIGDRLNGRLFEIIESLGLPEKQSEAVKSIIRKEVWDIICDERIILSSKFNTEIREKYYKMKNNLKQGDLVPCFEM